MKKITYLTKRNIKMFFKDKALFFTALITPLILLVLYATFLSNVYKDSFLQVFSGFPVSEDIIDGLVGGQLVSSLLAVSCITVAFCSNMLMVQDKVTGAFGDFCISPVRRSELAVSYFIASAVSTLIITTTAIAFGLTYLAFTGWFLSVADVFSIILDTALISLFGTALSSIVNCFLTSQGQISAVGSIVSSCYGFICGAYMPISSFGEGLANVLYCLPGTYATSLLRNHTMRGAVDKLSESVPTEMVEVLKETVDMKISFFGGIVPLWVMTLIVTFSLVISLGAYIAVCVIREKRRTATK